MELVRSDRLGDDASHLSICLNIPEFDITAQDPLVHKVIMHFYVLRASMENGVLGQLHATDIVAVDRN